MDLNKLQPPLESQLSLLGFELTLLESAREGRDEVLRIFIEHADHGRPVTLDDCVAVNDGLMAWLDVEFPSLRETTAIEVSSPGVERLLVKAEHFSRFIGRLCKTQTRSPLNGQKRFKGWISAVSDSAVTLEEDGNLKQIPINLIQRARLAPFDEDLAPKPKYAATAAEINHAAPAANESAGAEKSASREA
ncbi:MAG: ribosome maturation factor RimP [Holophagales bacterium]|nr:ribosome maturation factor RimP [Holophagales bacterium]